MKKQLIRAAASSVLGLSLMTGFAAADINTTGPGSSNHQQTNYTVRHFVRNNNNVQATNTNHQYANTGSATVYYNTKGGSAASGYATNQNAFQGTVAVNNTNAGGCGCTTSGSGGGGAGGAGNITLTGPNSNNTTSFNSSQVTSIQNNNNIRVTNSNTQTATTGNATVSYNTVGGNAVSGDATNTNTASFNISVQN